MMLSHDLTNLAAFLSLEALSKHEMTQETRSLLTTVADRLEGCANRAASLEAEPGRRPVVIDLSDGKVALFPKAKRPIPAHKRDGGDVA